MPPAEQLYAENRSLKQEVAELRAQLEWFKRKVFGGGQSEKLLPAPAQAALALEGLTEKAATPAVQTVTYERRTPSGEKRPLPAETFAKLPVHETVVVEPPEVQVAPECFERIGEERTFEVDIVLPKLFKLEIVRPKYRRKAERMEAPVIAPAPARPVSGGYASAGLLAFVVISKYHDHLPLYRLEQMSP